MSNLKYNLINGNIITLNDAYPIAKSVTVENGKIDSINDTDSKLKIIDLKGLTVLPGLVDSHYHLSNFGKRLEMINLKGVKSIDDIFTLVSNKVKELGPESFIHGFGWDQTLWPDEEFPAKDVLNHFKNNPIILTRIDGHSLWTNDTAINMSTYTNDLIVPNGGDIINGCIFIDNAMDAIRAIIPKNNKENNRAE